eukprot:CAMPEP_0181295856 /NCGR_PEP_ID=MMETSP1101-20121128/4376_1 /TAXON_ID=46948 /ORGANISM="Rhodomonas abbreviata, Strain Caron Lab Isolate" /LENGTH=176 /DNA_ID=CAMNT_0023400647 /DNA_START=100 /DNA_END=627 /DNA_ORIENTATION=+
MAGIVGWVFGEGTLDLTSAQQAISELVEEREQMQARLKELEGAYRLLDKTVLITGAGGDIGREAALELTKEGAKTVLIDKDEALLKQTHAQVTALNRGESVMFSCDVTDSAAVGEVVREAEGKLGRIDGAFINAGVQGDFKSIEEYPLTAFQEVMHINVTGTFITLQAVAQAMKAR